MAGNSNDTGTRIRNTLINARSKETQVGGDPGALGVADPGSYGAYAASVMGAQTQLAGALALSRAGIGGAKAQFMLDAEQAKQLRVSETAGAVNTALDRGIVNSSVDLANRAGAITDSVAARQQALVTRNQTIAQLRGQNIQALGAYYGTLGEASFSLQNSEALAAIERYKQGLYDSYYGSAQKLRNRGRTRDLGLPGGNGPGVTSTGYQTGGGF